LKRAAFALCGLGLASALASVACVEIAGIERKAPSGDAGPGSVQGPSPDGQAPGDDAQTPSDDAATE
jgi:hypothetical protein